MRFSVTDGNRMEFISLDPADGFEKNMDPGGRKRVKEFFYLKKS